MNTGSSLSVSSKPTFHLSLKLKWLFLGLSEPAEDKGKLSISCVAVEGAKESLSREEAGAILSGTSEFVTGAETASSVDTWHYTSLKL